MFRRISLSLKAVVTLLCVQFIIVGCVGIMPSIKSPRVSITDLRVQEVTPLETTFKVALRIINPNDFSLSIKGAECDLEINDQTFGSGVSGDMATIPAYGTDVVSMLVYSSVIDMVRGFLKLPGQEHLTYKIKGALRVSVANAPAVTVPFESDGKIDLKTPIRPQ